ncbi:MAG: IclR family transcriptional regulator [Hyphomicrobiales bacterium]|nr:IclR family transcriptional regulator [Hyphomicrobiales bacterium]MCP5372994.1 IclR family transcriptional regulator [Hyphomicrobiales bacterium]
MRTSTAKTDAASAAARGGPQSVGRVFAILEALADARTGATLAELAVATGAPKTSLVGLLAGLTAEDGVVRDGAGRYFLGSRFLALAMRAVAGRELVALARPVLARLAEASGETAVLGALAPDADLATYLDKAESSNPIRYAVTVGERRELYCTALGKVLLAHFPRARLERYLKEVPRKRFTPETITGAKALRAELERVRREGIARTRDERGTGANALAAPVFGPDGAVVAAVLLAGPAPRMAANAAANERLVRAAADECNRLAGGAPPDGKEKTKRTETP